jgi:peptide deformylase
MRDHGRWENGDLRTLLKIVHVGDPVLRQEARELTVTEIREAEIQRLIEAMRETMNDAPGVGLAAPQVGLPLRIAVIEDKPEYTEKAPKEAVKERERSPVPFHVIINPKIRPEPSADVKFYEGCLSLPGFLAMVPRKQKVVVDCLDHRGEPRTLKASGWYARILQHEIDHLDGMVYVDRMVSRTFTSAENLNRFFGGVFGRVPGK